MGTVRYTVLDGEVISERRNGVLHDYMVDPLGSTIGLVDSTQSVTDTFAYSPFGEVVSRTGTTATPFQYVGSQGYYKDSSSRSYVRARSFNVNLGRWMTQDPIGFEGGDWNLFRYVANNGIIWKDPSGFKIYKCCTDQIFAHCFLSTDQCGAWGLHPQNRITNPFVGSPGIVFPDEDYLQPAPLPRHRRTPSPKKQKAVKYGPAQNDLSPRKGIPGKGGTVPDDKNVKVICKEVSLPSHNGSSPEQNLCNCIASSAHNPPWFNIIDSNCQHWADSIFDCACNKSGGTMFEGCCYGPGQTPTFTNID